MGEITVDWEKLKEDLLNGLSPTVTELVDVYLRQGEGIEDERRWWMLPDLCGASSEEMMTAYERIVKVCREHDVLPLFAPKYLWDRQ